MHELVQKMVRGAAAGSLATAPMTLAMLATKPLLPAPERAELPPEQVTAGVLENAGVADDLSSATQEQLSLVAHFAFGAAAGAVYGLAAPANSSRQVSAGVLLGLGVWSVSYFGSLPAAGVRHSAWYDAAGRHLQLALSHVVWGGTTGWLWSILDQPGQGDDQRELSRMQSVEPATY